MNKRHKAQILKVKKVFSIKINEDQTKVYNNMLYVSTRQAAKLFNVTYHSFAVLYARKITNKVRVITAGRHKFYHLADVTSLIDTSYRKNVTISELCK